MGDIVRIDSKGRFFRHPTFYLNPAEYAKVISEINNNYDLYKDKRYCFHASVGIDNQYHYYMFENHGFNDYNIFDKFDF